MEPGPEEKPAQLFNIQKQEVKVAWEEHIEKLLGALHLTKIQRHHSGLKGEEAIDPVYQAQLFKPQIGNWVS